MNFLTKTIALLINRSIEKHRQNNRCGSVYGHRDAGVGITQVEAFVEPADLVERVDRHARITQLSLDVGAQVGVAAVERDRVECRGQSGIG